MPVPATDSISVADISTDLQNYALDNQEHLIQQVTSVGFDGIPGSPLVPLDDYVMFLPTTGEVVLTDLIVDDPLQPGGTDTFDPKNEVVKYKTRKASVKPAKVDLKFKHTKIMAMYNTYIGRVKSKKIDPKTYPYEEDVIKKILKAVKKYLRLAMWQAEHNEADKSFMGLFDGWIKQILDAIALNDGSINIVDIDAINGTNAVAQLTKMKKALPAGVRYGNNAVLILNEETKDFYEENYQALHGTLPYNTGFTKKYLDGSNIEIIVEEGLAGFDRPIITTRENLVFLYDDENKQNNVDFDYQKRDRSLAYIMDFFTGVGICATELIWVGDSN
ncbi:hypothetical protein GCM10011514_06300 [Emticicia aquatilis]|uniref:Uncharacterized protein n=1 Tax=Emticicia aquatilis TaxID=1537369 RepID=A0A916YHK5_9BACT|nr:hypothetical protein [Emticicia aquatilis]GGD45024.1 hypothetical protein GCM10011514_06300 [Emticicia aquatilis]